LLSRKDFAPSRRFRAARRYLAFDVSALDLWHR
jgi:hypothetical protein